MFEAVL